MNERNESVSTLSVSILAAFDLVCIKRLLFLYFWSIHCWIFSYKRPSFCCFYGIKSFWVGKPAILNIALKSFVIIISWSLNARHKFIKVSVYAGVGMWWEGMGRSILHVLSWGFCIRYCMIMRTRMSQYFIVIMYFSW